ncbi:Methyltransferase type 11 [Cordyceps fumosorosea ARSEF 2679]|uniref:Methyltransferase type 11 n=1 Tax=Cordyceps fumosorosea (strain ARSEF 2679) TaxID=1081104 RepID=A0A168BX77_CORFA|nr:Methyltransferase type 11 [Cordyceps fumosorosea ARSEF 2679]OAA70663.1 Methyltransferase type 11 [Cordyceps fumosorosea ARSEF 2679]
MSGQGSSNLGDVVDVGTADEVAVIYGIEKGVEYVDSDYTDDTQSLTSSIRQHIVDGGLRYHAYHAGQYAFPNDENEQHRDDLKHNLTLHLCDGKYFLAPIEEVLKNGAQVLDLGTGNGKWCIELADIYPNSTFQGMDLSPIQPDWVPQNVSFVVDDIEHTAGWTYEENMFDYIHVRHIVHSVRDRQELWHRIYKHLKPGGYVEIQEFEYVAACDDSSCDGPYAWRDFLENLRKGLSALGGSDLLGVRQVDAELARAGFRGLGYRQKKCPNGPWARRRRLQECGHILRDVCMQGLIGLARRPFRDGLQWTPTQTEVFLVDVRRALMAVGESGLPRHHSYFPFHNLYAQKPLDA